MENNGITKLQVAIAVASFVSGVGIAAGVFSLFLLRER